MYYPSSPEKGRKRVWDFFYEHLKAPLKLTFQRIANVCLTLFIYNYIHLISGNIGNAFSIDETLGTIQVAKELDINSMHYEYLLNVKATDKGKPPLSSTLTVHIMVVMADNAPPRYNLSTMVEF